MLNLKIINCRLKYFLVNQNLQVIMFVNVFYKKAAGQRKENLFTH